MVRITGPFYETAYGSMSGYFDTLIFAVIILAGGMVGVQVRARVREAYPWVRLASFITMGPRRAGVPLPPVPAPATP